MLAHTQIYIYVRTVFFCFTRALLLDLSLSISAPVLLYSLPYSDFPYIYTRALLLLYYYLSCCVCVYIFFTPALLRLDL